tara:strand:- start:205 stop:894 length:690 start_codon:yes stop_codon:yes gene_type:complete
MKTIGLLGGMSWESTELYYRLINEETKRQLGGLHSAPIAMVSVDFDKLEKLQHADDWSAMAEMLSKRARQVEVAGADFLLICSNTMHKVADEVAESIDIPLLHLADATARRIVDAGIRTVGLLGTRFTMEHDFYKDILREHGLKVLTPAVEDRTTVHRVIYDELCLGLIRDASRQEFRSIMDALMDAGAEAVIEGCTEIGMLVAPNDTDIRLFDTTRIHAEEAVAYALS